MTRPQLVLGALAAVLVGTLLWCAWLILDANLTLGTSIAAWGLWLLIAAAAVTGFAYVREVGRHRQAVSGGGSWKPLPSLVLIWIGGLTAVAVFAFMLPSSAATTGPDSKTSAEAPAAPVMGTPTPSATTSASPRASATTASRSKPRTTTPAVSPTSATHTQPAGRATTASSTASAPSRSSAPTSTTTTSTPSSTQTPIVTITLPHHGH